MEQDELFSNPIAHTNDPTTSHLAADKITKSGKRVKHADIVLDLVQRFPDSTAVELVEQGSLREYQVRRRLTDLMHAGKVVRGAGRECRVRGSQMVTWRAA